MSSLGGHRRSGASGNHDESGNSMGHGGFGVSVSNGGVSTTSRGILEVLGLGGARKALNWTEPAETKESWAGPAETKESWAGPAETKESWAGFIYNSTFCIYCGMKGQDSIYIYILIKYFILCKTFVKDKQRKQREQYNIVYRT